MLAIRGYNVSLIDLDVYAPSLQNYFDFTPRKWINDLLIDNAKIADVMTDMTPVAEKLSKNSENKAGKLWVGFSNSNKEEIYKLEAGVGKHTSSNIELLRKFIQLREHLISDYDSDYVIIDTSPGVRYWSINALAIADTLFLTLKFGELDIEGTKKMAKDIYRSFTKFGAKSFLLLNRVEGYCVPHANTSVSHPLTLQSRMPEIDIPQYDNPNVSDKLAKEIGMDMISAIPCYCDIQFIRREFLTVLQHPEHPFARQLEKLANTEQIKA
jgi:cellulose biosynthesis protein BcsQ